MNTKVNEGKLISGKEALIALASGEEVQCANADILNWNDVVDDCHVGLFTTEKNRNGFDFVFRLKPRTILINGIEAPSIKKESAIYRSNDTVAIVCESFEDAELMCLALRQVFGGSHDN